MLVLSRQSFQQMHLTAGVCWGFSADPIHHLSPLPWSVIHRKAFFLRGAFLLFIVTEEDKSSMLLLDKDPVHSDSSLEDVVAVLKMLLEDEQ